MFYIDTNPVAFSVLGFKIYWYSLSYIITIVISYVFLIQQNKKLQITTRKNIESFTSNVILGILIGGRLGYVLIYNPKFYFANPSKILMLQNGGMSWHGAFVVCVGIVFFFCKKHNINIFSITDIIVRTIPIGFFLGRISNLINQELWGRQSDSDFPLSVVFSSDPMQITRHPSQIYEAIGEGLFLFFIINFAHIYNKKHQFCKKNHENTSKKSSNFAKITNKYYVFNYKNTKKTQNFSKNTQKFAKKDNFQSKNTFIFLIFYPIIRFFCEFFRAPDPQIGLILKYFTIGQILNLLIVFFTILFYKLYNFQENELR